MGRKRKRKRRRTRRATKAELSEEQPGREMAVDEAVEEEEDDTEMNPASAAAAAAGEREEEEGIEGLLEPFTQDELLGLLLSSLGPTSPDRKLFVDNVPACAAHDELRRLFSRFGEIEAGPLGADRATGQFRGYAIFFYKSPKGLTKALEERKVVFDGCELHCRRAHRANKEKHHMATHADAGDQSNDFVSAASPIVHGQPKEIALTSSKQTLLGSNRPVELMVKGPSSGTVPFCQNAGAGLLGAFPVAAVSPSTLDQSTMVNYSRDSTSTPRNDRLEMS
uniref:RRM domain-containing protein n=1 Tax=Oryza brachyantha TaxID=4533 RepID=J3LEJ2_ORYBR